MAVVLGLALALIVVGLVMAALSPHLKFPALVAVVYWAGVVLVVVGLILLLSPVIAWAAAQLRAMLGQ